MGERWREGDAGQTMIGQKQRMIGSESTRMKMKECALESRLSWGVGRFAQARPDYGSNPNVWRFGESRSLLCRGETLRYRG